LEKTFMVKGKMKKNMPDAELSDDPPMADLDSG